ncbi:MAG: hypothetical protein J6T57_01285 [Alphaproteobacteria bacterium]|nr:hypothetical protein [Alphaproteobacteria bacterium]
MKKMHSLVIAAGAMAIGAAANAANFMPYGNSVSAYAISGIQHNISKRALGGIWNNKLTNITSDTEYSDPDEYGSMLYYGEFGDDTGILPMIGRSGGDEYASGHIGVDWSHFADEIKFHGLPNMDSDSDTATVSFAPRSGAVDFEVFGGYAGHHSRNSSLDVDGDGGFVGIASGVEFEGFHIGFVADAGILATRVETLDASRRFENVWVAFAAGAGYNHDLAQGIKMHIGVNGGYTWVNAPNYVSNAGENIDVTNFGIFEVTPTLGIIGDLGSGWRAAATVDYVMNFTTGGKTTVDYVGWANRNGKDYIEYGIELGRSIDDFELAINIGRHDFGRTGWHGGIKINYLF